MKQLLILPVLFLLYTASTVNAYQSFGGTKYAGVQNLIACPNGNIEYINGERYCCEITKQRDCYKIVSPLNMNWLKTVPGLILQDSEAGGDTSPQRAAERSRTENKPQFDEPQKTSQPVNENTKKTSETDEDRLGLGLLRYPAPPMYGGFGGFGGFGAWGGFGGFRPFFDEPQDGNQKPLQKDDIIKKNCPPKMLC